MEKELHIFESWDDFVETINSQIGWQKMTLYGYYLKGVASETTEDGRVIVNLSNPHRQYLDNHFIGLKINGKFVGFCNVYLRDGDYFDIGNFEIIKPYTHKGYGALMLSEVIKAFRYKKYKHIYLNAYTSDAKAFWRKQGFKTMENDETMFVKNLA